MKQEKNLEGGTETVTTKAFTIKGAFYGNKCFPGLNDLLHEASTHPTRYAKMKKDYEMLAINAIRRQLRGYKATGVVIPTYKFYEPLAGQIRDYDNIVAGGRKIINDALVKTKVIEDDKPKFLQFGFNEFYYTKSEPRIEVCLLEVSNVEAEIQIVE